MAQSVHYVGWKLHLMLSHVKHKLFVRGVVFAQLGGCYRIEAYTQQCGKETVLMLLRNLNISYWCDEVLTEQGLPFIPGNKRCCRIQTISAER